MVVFIVGTVDVHDCIDFFRDKTPFLPYTLGNLQMKHTEMRENFAQFIGFFCFILEL